DGGAKVLLIEKMPHPGGISILSGGGVAFARNADGAFQYLKRTCNGTTPDDILRTMAQEMVGIIDWVKELAKVSGTEPTQTETRGHGTYPFPGTNDIDSIKLKDFPAYSVYLVNTGDGIKMAQKAGATLWHMWHFHGGYGFKFPEFPFAIRHVWAGPRNENRKMIWIAVNKFGRRFMDEYPPAPQDTG